MADSARQPRPKRLRLVDQDPKTEAERLGEVYELIRQIARRIEAEDAAKSRGEGQSSEQ